MPFLVFKSLHVGSMFLATALAVGPSVLLYLIARNGEPATIRRAFGHTTTVFRTGAVAYGLGIVFGAAAALTGQIDLGARWLLTAYVLVGILIVMNLGFERWTKGVQASAADPDRLHAAVSGRAPLLLLSAMVFLTLAIVFVMVVKPNLLG
jgi:uncharacterized membrane protein